jgi:hypothetical protein
VNWNPASPNLLVFLNGGGACWDYSTCYTLNTAVHGPFGAAEFQDAVASGAAGSLLDRTDAQNPVRDWNLVFVPYCTGDLHGGNNVMTYTAANMPARTYHHVGHANFVAFMARIAASVKAPAKFVLSGSSAGGYGSTMNFDTARDYYRTGEAYLLDDSGPALVGDDILVDFRIAMYKSWGLGPLIDPICPGCRDDFSLAYPTLGTLHPHDRMALLSSLQDQVIRGYFLLGAVPFQNDLLKLATTVLDPTANWHYFFVDGETHTMLGGPAGFTSSGVNLWDWLTQFVGDDPAWTSHKP